MRKRSVLGMLATHGRLGPKWEGPMAVLSNSRGFRRSGLDPPLVGPDAGANRDDGVRGDSSLNLAPGSGAHTLYENLTLASKTRRGVRSQGGGPLGGELDSGRFEPDVDVDLQDANAGHFGDGGLSLSSWRRVPVERRPDSNPLPEASGLSVKVEGDNSNDSNVPNLPRVDATNIVSLCVVSPPSNHVSGAGGTKGNGWCHCQLCQASQMRALQFNLNLEGLPSDGGDGGVDVELEVVMGAAGGAAGRAAGVGDAFENDVDLEVVTGAVGGSGRRGRPGGVRRRRDQLQGGRVGGEGCRRGGSLRGELVREGSRQRG